MAYIVIVLLAISSLLCLNLFLIHWGEPDDYSFSEEVRGTINVLKRRAIVLEIAVWISIASLFIGVIVVSMGETI
jgi:preprotein translocase subunit SecG